MTCRINFEINEKVLIIYYQNLIKLIIVIKVLSDLLKFCFFKFNFSNFKFKSIDEDKILIS